MIQIEQQNDVKLLVIHASSELTKEDCQHFVPEFDRVVEDHGKMRVLFEIHDFHGWKPRSVWEDTKFDVRHFSDIERIALVGDKRWQRCMSKFCSSFTGPEIPCFDRLAEPAAETWLKAA